MLLFNEIFDEFRATPKREDKIKVLQKYDSHNFKEFLNFAFNPKILFDVTTIPTYKPSVYPAGLSAAYLFHEVNKLYMFIPVHKKYAGPLPLRKQQAILHVLLTSLFREEAVILEQLMLKKLKVEGMTPKLLKEAFPDLPF